jgi:hypothetical protein
MLFAKSSAPAIYQRKVATARDVAIAAHVTTPFFLIKATQEKYRSPRANTKE